MNSKPNWEKGTDMNDKSRDNVVTISIYPCFKHKCSLLVLYNLNDN